MSSSRRTRTSARGHRGIVVGGSATVFANHRPLARHGDAVRTCNDPVDVPVGLVVARGTVLAGH
jgi:uncharacterized Zn-binding protein involved in type VI secretion